MLDASEWNNPASYNDGVLQFLPIKSSTVEDVPGTYVYEILIYYNKDERSDLYVVNKQKLTFIVKKALKK